MRGGFIEQVPNEGVSRWRALAERHRESWISMQVPDVAVSRKYGLTSSSDPEGRVILVTEVFFPVETSTGFIMSQIADRLSRDHRVLVLTGPASYERGKRLGDPSKSFSANVEVVRLRAPAFDKNRLLGRVARQVVLSIGLAFAVMRRAEGNDIVLAVTNPPPLVFLLGCLRRFKRFKFMLLVHDVFPENGAAIGIYSEGTHFYRILKRFFDKAYSSADVIISIGRDMADVIKAKILGPPPDVHVIENWADIDGVRPVRRGFSRIGEWGLSEKVVVQYAGNLGRAQGISELMQVLSRIRNEDVHFVISGAGVSIDNIKANPLSFVTLQPPFTRDEQSMVLGSCDIGLVTLGRGMYGLGVPSKAYNLLAAGKPILFIGPRESEIFRLVKENEIGWAFDWDEPERYEAFLNTLRLEDLNQLQALGIKARAIAESRYCKSSLLDRLGQVVDSTAWKGG